MVLYKHVLPIFGMSSLSLTKQVLITEVLLMADDQAGQKTSHSVFMF